MIEPFWAKMPCGWQTNLAVYELIKKAPVGTAIAALKLYLGFCLAANFNTKTTLPSTGCVKKTISQLCDLVSLSRPMVIKGLRQLEEWGFTQSLGGRPAIYQILEYETAPYWTKLPKQHLYGSAKNYELLTVNKMGNRGKTVLHGLMLYMYLASIRDKQSNRAMVTYEQMKNVLGLNKNQISAAISTLVINDMATVRQGDVPGTVKGISCNVYWLRGSIYDPVNEAKELAAQRAADHKKKFFQSTIFS